MRIEAISVGGYSGRVTAKSDITQLWCNRRRRCDSMTDMAIPCPCCGFRTLQDSGGFEMSPVCYWGDDGQSGADADVVRGGPNGSLSLSEARRNFADFGASDLIYVGNVRPPLDIER